ncbi:sugar phosphate isomerase/epimerase family protein [Dactylosporangium sp. CA-092794]|uniref:sugar phosphate isomerase/epimerase family protein n=1 Tax=Dactylosporangium sp. CA-092794 TaxID=3239929 RepID=UPI003D932375
MTGTGRLGVFASSLADVRLDVDTAVSRAAGHGFTACLFGSVFDVSPTLDHGEIAARRDAAAAQGVEVAVGSVNLHPFRAGQDDRLLAAGDGDALAGLGRMVEAAALLPGRDLLVIIGRIEDRYDRLTPWPEQLDLAARLLRRLGPVLRDHGLRLALKTHEEITATEVARLIDAAGADVACASLDPVNLLVNLQDPVTAAGALLPAVGQVVLDDAVLALAGGVGTRLLCPVGEGVVDWPGVVAAVAAAAPTYWVELHRGQFTVAPFDPGWHAHHPDLTLAEYTAVVRAMVRCTASLLPARLAALRAHQARPTQRLAATTTAARSLLFPQCRKDHHHA